MRRPTVVAIGGNSLIRSGQRGSIEEQRANALITARAIAGLVQRGHAIVITHGNGPQVGAQLLRSEIAADQVCPEPLDVCGADTQGAIGYILEQALIHAFAETGVQAPVATVLTQVVVNPADPAFQRPTKPVGPFYTAEQAQQRARDRGWTVVEDAARGWRRVAPSPEPCEIVEIDAIRDLVASGYVVIAVGGGGIPVVRRDGELAGVEAVIDKDLAAALLARLLRARLLIISTDVACVYLHYRQENETPLRCVRAAVLRRYAAEGHFPPGTMGPKIEAALRFLAHGGREVIITSPELLTAAVAGRSGTHILPDRTPPRHRRRASGRRGEKGASRSVRLQYQAPV
jgi:carbamate kinase